LSKDEEKAFLEPFIEQAAKGQIVTTKLIKQAFEQHVGQEVDESTIYRLLQRHQWRKIVPRPVHPKADPEEQETFKNRQGSSPVRSSNCLVHTDQLW
jgi:transposase